MPTLEEEIKELEEKLNSAPEDVAPAEEPVAQEEAAAPVEEAADVEAPVEEAKQEEAPEEPKQDNAEMARKRIKAERENEELKRKLAEAEARANAQQQPAPQVDVPPDPKADPVGYLSWENKKLQAKLAELEPVVQDVAYEKSIERATQGFGALQQQFLEEGTVSPQEFQQVFDGIAGSFYNTILVQNPNLTPQQAARETKVRMLEVANRYYEAGMNPAQAFYQQGLAMGFKPQAAPVAAPAAPEPKPTIASISKNMKAPSSPVAAGGRAGKQTLTMDAINSMSPAELVKNYSQVQALLEGAA